MAAYRHMYKSAMVIQLKTYFISMISHWILLDYHSDLLIAAINTVKVKYIIIKIENIKQGYRSFFLNNLDLNEC